MLRRSLLTGLFAALVLASTLPVAEAGGRAGTANGGAQPRRSHLPLVGTPGSPPAGISGRVTYQGAGVGGIRLVLFRAEASAEEPVAETLTAADGEYLFAVAPSLPLGAVFYVVYENRSDPRYVGFWGGPDILSYEAGQQAAGGDFDIEDVELLSPESGQTVGLPAEFSWQNRAPEGEDYTLELFDPDTGDWWQAANLGDVDRVTVSGVPQEVETGKAYGWFVRVCTEPTSCGASYASREVSFELTAASAAAGAHRSPVLLSKGHFKRSPAR